MYIKNKINNTEKKGEKMFNSQNFTAISGTGNHEIDKHILKWVNKFGHCNIEFLHLKMGKFADLESDVKIANYEKLKRKYLLLFQSAYSLELKEQFLNIAWAAKNQYGAKAIIGIVPFMYYRRQENEQKPEEINRNKMFINNMKDCGVDYLILCDIHSADHTLKYCKEYKIKAWNIDPSPAYADHLMLRYEYALRNRRSFFVYAPDCGSVPRAVSLAKAINVKAQDNKVKVAMSFKRRDNEGNLTSFNDPEELKKVQEKYDIEIVPADKNLKNACVAMREDEVTTGKTAKKTGDKLKKDIGVYEMYLCATHPICSPEWTRKLGIDDNSCSFDDIFFGDTIPRGYEKSTGGKIITVHMANVIGPELCNVISEIDK